MKKIVNLILLLCLSLSCLAIEREKAGVMAPDFVRTKLNYPKEASFNSLLNPPVVEADGYNKFIVIGTFTAKNAYGVKSDMAYKIWLEYVSGDWAEMSSWRYSKMIIEDSATGKQNVYTSEPRSSKPKTTSGQTIEFLGVSCNIVEYLNAAIRLQTPRKFTKAEIEKGMKSFPYKNKIVYFTRVKDRSNDYASVINGEIFYF